MSSKPSTSHSHRHEQGDNEEVSFGDFTNIQGHPRNELFEGDFSVLDGYSSVMIGDGLASPSFMYDQDSKQVAEMQHKLTDAQDTIRQLRHRLVRRTSVIEGIRKYYLRDVVTMKHILRDLLSETERKEAWRQYEYILPSIDLKESLQLHAPERCAFQVTPCENCGGRLELIMRDNEEVEKLKKVIKEYKEREGRWRIKLADLDAQLDTIQKEKAEYTKVHTDEKRVLYVEMKKLREEVETYKEETHKTKVLNRKLKEENDGFRLVNGDLQQSVAKLVLTEKELDFTRDKLTEANESVKQLKMAEKILTKELQQSKQDSRELSTSNESNTSTIKALQGEIRQLQVTIERMQFTYQELQENLEVNNQQNLELTNKLLELEDTVRNSTDENSKVIETYENSMEKMRADLKATTKKSAEITAECKKLKARVEEKNILIEDLHKVNRNQELELLDNAEEIELLEQEIKAMQQFVKQKIAEQSRKAKEQRSNEPEHEEIVNFFKRLDEVEAHLHELAVQAEQEKLLEEASLSARVAKVPSADPAVKEEEQVTSLMQRRAALRQQRTMRKSVEMPTVEEKVKRVKRRIKPQAQDAAGKGAADEDSGGEDGRDLDADSDGSDAESVRSTRARATNKSKVAAKKHGSKISTASKVAVKRLASTEEAPPPSRERKANPAAASSSTASPAKVSTSTTKGKVKAKVKVNSRTRSRDAKSVKDKKVKERIGGSIDEGGDDGGNEDVAEAVRLTTEALGMANENEGDDNDEYEYASSDGEVEYEEEGGQTARGSTESDNEEEAAARDDDEAANEEVEEDQPTMDSKSSDPDGQLSQKARTERKQAKTKIPQEAKPKQPKAPKESKAPREPKEPKEKKVVIKKVVIKAEEEPEEEEDDEPEQADEPEVMDDVEDAEDEPEPEEEIDDAPEEVEEEEVVEEVEVIEHESLSEEELARRKEVALMRGADKEAKQAARHAKQEAKRLEREMKQRERELKKQEKEAQRAIREATRLEKERKKKEREDERMRKHEEKMRAMKKVKIVTKEEIKAEEVEVEEEEAEAIEEGAEESSGSEAENEEDDQDPEVDEGDVEMKVYNRTRKMSNRKAKAAPKKKKTKTKTPKPKPEVKVVEKVEIPVEKPVEVKPPPAKPAPKPPRPATANPDNAVINISYVKDGSHMFLETQLKEALQNSLANYDELDATVMQNVVNDVLKTVGVLFDQTVKIMWDGMLANKEGLDLAQKLSVILTGILDVDEEATSENIADVCSKLVPIAGTTLTSHVTDMWKERCELDDAVLADLIPAIVDYESNARHTKDYYEVFHTSSLRNAQETYDKLRSIYENSYKMNSVFHDMYDELSKQLVSFLSDWSIYKTASKEAANRLEAEKEHIKAQYDQKISNLGKELSKGTILLERTMEKLKVAEVKIKELKAVEALYNSLETKHADLSIDYELNKKTLAEMQVDYGLIKGEQKLYYTTMKELQECVSMAHEEGVKFQYHYVTTKLEKHGVEKALEMKEQECKKLQADYKILVDREYSRLNLLNSISMQTEPEVADMAIQTEFLVPPMDLRTVVVDKLSRSNVRQYPMVYSQSLDQMPSLSRGNTPGTGLRESGKPTSSHRMSNASVFSADSQLSDLQGVHTTGMLAPHSPPLSKYHNSYNEEDLNSFLSLRMPSGGGVADGVYTPRSVSSSHSHTGAGAEGNVSSSQQSKSKLSKNKWGSSAGPMMIGKNIGDNDHSGMYISSSHSVNSQNSATNPPAPTTYSIALETSHSFNDRQFNFDNIDVSGPPSPVAQGRKEMRDDLESGRTANGSINASRGSFKAPKQSSSLPETKHIVYNNKFSDGSAKFRTINSKRAEEPIGDLGSLMVSSAKGGAAKPIMSQSLRPQAQMQVGALNLAAAGLSTSSSLGHAGLSSITNVNSDTIKKMRKDLLSR